MSLTNFRAEDFKKSGEAKPEKVQPAVAPKENDDEVPVGTTAEILEWVGDDKDRAQRALDAEYSHENPRKTLVPQLQAIVDADGEDEETENE